MINPKKIEKIARQFHESIPKGIVEFGDNVEKKIHQIIQSQLVRFNLVNRTEFDEQTKVLLHIRKKISSLEYRLNELEKSVCEKKKGNSKSKEVFQTDN